MSKPISPGDPTSLLPQKFVQIVKKAISENDLENAIAKLEKLVDDSKLTVEVEKLKLAELEEENRRRLAIRSGQKPAYSVFKYEKKK